ncbi:MAG TPA: hypothetical protein VF746_15065 [Longimicrobium sp.]|jgi:hypothetical protein
MKKLNLKLDELKVETFETGVSESLRGTVRMNQQQTNEPCCTWSCGGTCGAAPDTTFLKGTPAVDDVAFRTFNKCCV